MSDVTEQVAAALEVTSVSGVLGRLDEISATIAAAMEEQDAVTCEVTRNTQTAATSAREVMQTLQGVREASAATARSSSAVLDSASRLDAPSGVLTKAVDGCLSELRRGA